MLDIVFRLEREFGIKNPHGELFPHSIFRGDPDLVSDYLRASIEDLPRGTFDCPHEGGRRGSLREEKAGSCFHE